MDWKNCVKGRLDSEKGQMKKRLMEWGCTIEYCGRKQEEIRRFMKLREEQKKLIAENDLSAVEEMLERIDRQYEEGIERLHEEMLEKMREKQEIDRLLDGLTEEEQEFVQMRYQKGCGFDFIGIKLHMSRATIFRMQDQILEKLLQAEDETA